MTIKRCLVAAVIQYYPPFGHCQPKWSNRQVDIGSRHKSPFCWLGRSPEVIGFAVFRYVKYPLSLRNVEALLFECCIDICHETLRLGWNRFGLMFAAEMCCKRVNRMRNFTQWRWQLDEVFVKIKREQHYVWGAADHEGEVLEFFASKTRDKDVALKFIKSALRRHGRPQVIVADRCRTYGAAMKEIGNVGKL